MYHDVSSTNNWVIHQQDSPTYSCHSFPFWDHLYITYITWTLNNKLFFDHLRSVQMISPTMWTRCSDDLRCLVPALCTFVAIRGSKMMKFSQLQQIFLDPVSDPALIWWSPWGRRRSLAAFLDRDDDAPLSSSFHNYTSPPNAGLLGCAQWEVPGPPKSVERTFWTCHWTGALLREPKCAERL